MGTAGIIFLSLPEGFSGNKKNEKLFQNCLEAGFLNPPDSAKPQTWWNWREGRISKEGITAELEAMKRIGLSGVTMFSTTRFGEMGPKITCLSPEWHERIKFALQECDRLGLNFSFHNCAGWSEAGGPWIKPDKAMQHVVYTTHTVEGGATIKLDAPPSWPKNGDSYYRDISVLAFPTPPAWDATKMLPSPKLTSSLPDFDLSNLETDKKDSDAKAEIKITIPEDKTEWIQFEFPDSVTCRSIIIAGSKEKRLPDDHRAIVLASDDGKQFREVTRLSTYLCDYRTIDFDMTHAIPQTSAKYFRLEWQGPALLNLRRVVWSLDPAIYSYESKIGEHGKTLVAEPALPFERDIIVSYNRIIDLTYLLDDLGNFTWKAPPGNWTLVRIGYRSTGIKNAPAPPEATGLECDKFNPDAVKLHFNHYVKNIVNDAREKNIKVLDGILLDSWEAGSQNWSPVFREEFRKRRGYDVQNYLPAFAGFIVETREITDRFLRDIRQTMSDLVSENFFGTMSKLAHDNGLQTFAESCGGSGSGTMVADGVQHYFHVDIPMNELNWPLKEAVSAAHLQNKKVVALEAYTQGRANWDDCPATLKPVGDAALCAGITRFVFQGYAHNPDIEKIYPGPAFGPYGLPFSRGQTWWNMGHVWITYLSRCQYMLQLGKPTADVLYFYGEEPGGPIPTVFGANRRNLDEWTELPKGYDYDLLPAEILIKDLSFHNGKLVTGNGTSYNLLVLRDSDKMSPEAAEKIKDLVYSGSIVVGQKPKRSPSLRNYPQCDKIVERIGKEVWSTCDGKTITQHAYGKGRVFWGITLKEVLDAISLPPDFSADGDGKGTDLQFIHRKEGETDIYFVSNIADSMYMAGSIGEHWDPVFHAVDFTAGFRVTGKKPEIWDPVTGSIKDALSFRQENGRTFLPLHLDSHASLFVIFSKPIPADARGNAERNDPELHQKLLLEGPYTVKFTPGWGAPESIKFTKLEDWSKRPENEIKYYSGTAIYSISFDWKGSLSTAAILDLGRVEVIAGVRLNDKDCGIGWTPPYRVDITKALKAGRNDLEIRVANTWLNRLMGDGLGIKMGSEKRTWTTCNPFTLDPELTVPEISTRSMLYYKDLKREPVPSGLLGPVWILEQ